MNKITKLILFITLINISTSTLLPPSPGPIDSSQYSEEPIVAYYGSFGINGYYPLSDGCQKYYNTFNNYYSPIIVLNSTTYLASTYNSNILQIVLVSSDGISNIKVQDNLQEYAYYNNIKSVLSYDDKHNLFFFINLQNQIVSYNISSDSMSTFGVKDNVVIQQYPYLDLTTSTYYAATQVYSSTNEVLQTNYYVYSPGSFTLYSVDDLKLPYSLDKFVQVFGYNGNIFIFGISTQSFKSYLYQVNPTSKSFKLIVQGDPDVSIVKSTNPRYLLLISSTYTFMTLLDLSNYSSIQYSSVCPQTDFSNSFITSLAIKDIFNN